MATEIKVPELGESITEATVANWLKKEGDTVKKDEPIVELDTEKVTLEVNAPADGTLSEIKAEEDSDVEVGSVLGLIEEGDGDSSDDEEKEQKDEKDEEKTESKEDDKKSRDKDEKEKDAEEDKEEEDAAMSPSVRRLIEEKNLDPKKIEGSGKKGRITKSDVMDYLDKQENGEDEEKDDKESGKDEEKDEKKEEKKEKDEKPSGGGETRDIVVPELGESVSEATIAQWFKKEGDALKKDEALVELETEKVSLEVNAEADGVLKKISAEEGEDVEVGAVIGAIEVGAEASEEEEKEEKEEAEEEDKEEKETTEEDGAGEEEKKDTEEKDEEEKKREGREHYPHRPEGPREERVKMSRLRQSVAKRLKEAQDTAAMLTTFNEVDMSAVMEVRNKFKDSYEDKHGVRLGFMSFFIKVCIVALREIPEVNAEIDGNEIVYKNHYDIGVAVGSPQGLVVPVVRDADSLTFAEIEKKIRDFARQAHEGTLKLEDMTGGTFTISNGGVYGSMLSTPILNPPQSGILGMHNIEQRAMVMDDGSIEARPMMYLALSYDHRIVDGRGAVTFLKRVKECIEDPERIMLDI